MAPHSKFELDQIPLGLNRCKKGKSVDTLADDKFRKRARKLQHFKGSSGTQA